MRIETGAGRSWARFETSAMGSLGGFEDARRWKAGALEVNHVLSKRGDMEVCVSVRARREQGDGNNWNGWL